MASGAKVEAWLLWGFTVTIISVFIIFQASILVVGTIMAVVLIFLTFVAMNASEEGGHGKPMKIADLSKNEIYTFVGEANTTPNNRPKHPYQSFTVTCLNSEDQVVVFKTGTSLDATKGDRFMRQGSNRVAFVSRISGEV